MQSKRVRNICCEEEAEKMLSLPFSRNNPCPYSMKEEKRENPRTLINEKRMRKNIKLPL